MFYKFKELVKKDSSYNVIPINLNNKIDKELIEELIKASQHLINSCEKVRRFYSRRINDLGGKIEPEIVDILSKNTKCKRLGLKGYPDAEIFYKRRFYYLEIKTTTNWDSSFRSFYYTNPNKIKHNARHILLGLKAEEEKDKYWKIIDHKILDLYELKLYKKEEYNTSNSKLYEEELILNKGEIRRL